MNRYADEDQPFPEDYQRCNYVMTTDMFDWYCAMPAHPEFPHDHYMQTAVRA